MIYSVLVFLAKGGFLFFAYGFLALNGSYSSQKQNNSLWHEWVFCFGAFKQLFNSFKPREVKNTKDSIYNFFGYFNFCFWFLIIASAYGGLYFGLFGILLNLFIKY